MLGRVAMVAVGLLLLACDAKPKAGPGSGGPPPTSRAPTPPPRPQPSIRDNSSSGEPSDGVAPRARMLVSTLTSGDPIEIVLAFIPDTALPKNDPWYSEQLDWSAALATLGVELTDSGGKKRSLALAEPPSPSPKQGAAYFVVVLRIDGSGAGKLRWKTPIVDLLAKPGKYTIALTGTAKTDKRTLPLATRPLAFDVVANDEKHKAIAEIEKIAAGSAAARFAVKAPPSPTVPTIDDVNGNLWFRFIKRDDARPTYHVEVLELLYDRAGKELYADVYPHFTCVARGTTIDTPAGGVRVEELQLGEEITSYDVERRKLGTSRVERIDRSHAEHLHVLGRLRVTGEHPVFVDGRFVPARAVAPGARLLGPDLQPVAVSPLLTHASTTVFDVGVSAPHTYFADGVLVHNKAAHVPIGGSQPLRGYFYRRAAAQIPTK